MVQVLEREISEESHSSRRLSKRGISYLLVAGFFAVGALLLRGIATLPLDRSSLTGFHEALNRLSNWIDASRNSNPLFLYVVNEIRSFINSFVNFLQDMMSRPSGARPVPEIGWLGIIAIVAFGVLAFAGWRSLIGAVIGFGALGMLGFWSQSMDTLALTLAAVTLSLLIGIPLGVLAGLYPKFEKFLAPALDFAQVMPTFVYLTPVTLFFLIGPASATIVTLIYSIPPALRITSVAIREVPWGSVEAAISMGSTKWQALRKVQWPQARRTVVLGINQTIMAAFSMVTIAALIDAPGLGLVVVKALETLDVGRSFTAGLAIVIMAIVLDRSTTRAAERVEFTSVQSDSQIRTRRITLGGAALLAFLLIYLSRFYYWAAEFPGGGELGRFIARHVDTAVLWSQSHLYKGTNAITDFVTYGLINPLQGMLTGTPWFITGIAVAALSLIIGGIRLSVISALCIVALVGTGLWSDSMVTLAATLVAALITVLLGVVIGVWIGRSRTADRIVRPILDAGQVMPAFVYLIPCLGLFGATRFTAIVAAVIYAAPASIKLVADGIRGVPETIMEAMTGAGSSVWQLITKVQLPVARSAVALATNQGLIYVLAMVVVGGLVGAGGLGYLVVAGFSQENLKGKGLAAGLAIVLLGILLDRITQEISRGRRREG